MTKSFPFGKRYKFISNTKLNRSIFFQKSKILEKITFANKMEFLIIEKLFYILLSAKSCVR